MRWVTNLKVLNDDDLSSGGPAKGSANVNGMSRIGLGETSLEKTRLAEGARPRVLIVDDEINSLTGLAELVSREHCEVATAATLAEARHCLAKNRPDLILLDLLLPDGDGLELLALCEREPPGRRPEVVIISAYNARQRSDQALARGVSDYLVKPIQIPRLRSILARLAGPGAATAEVVNGRAELRKLDRFGRLMGSSRAMQQVYEEVARVAATSATVLLTGESGTGKEVVAQTIHDLSRRQKQPFLPVNCGAISPQLIESELFGHEKGSFTGAVRDHRGYFERAHGGTLFLDEITEMHVDLQVKLLRVLETHFFARVGSDRELESDVRIIAASNRCLDEAVRSGALREDLLYRLQVFPIHLPPVRERDQDIGLLASFFLDELNRSENTDKRLSAEGLELLLNHHWPGNLRELRNVIYRAFIMADDLIEARHFPPTLTTSPAVDGPFITVRVGSSVAEVERNLIMATLEHCGGRKEKAAEILGVSVKTLYNRLKEYEG